MRRLLILFSIAKWHTNDVQKRSLLLLRILGSISERKKGKVGQEKTGFLAFTGGTRPWLDPWRSFKITTARTEQKINQEIVSIKSLVTPWTDWLALFTNCAIWPWPFDNFFTKGKSWLKESPWNTTIDGKIMIQSFYTCVLEGYCWADQCQ